jgi:hypothetical protein
MLLYEGAGINYRESKNNGDDKLIERIIASELPAILMWMLEECVADYNTPGLFRERTAKQREAAKAYAVEDSPLQQWVTNEMYRSPEVDIDTLEALERYLDFCHRITGKKPNIRLSGFKQALKAAFPELVLGNRTTRPHPNRSFIKGLGYTPLTGVNVVPFPGRSKSDEGVNDFSDEEGK